MEGKMKRAVMTAPKTLVVEEAPIPELVKENDVLVKICYVGICGTDIHIFCGERDDVELPRVMGHELSGIVEETGKAVMGLKKGDHVTLDPVIACDHCNTCKSGHPNVCPDVKCYGVQMDGAFQDYIVVEDRRLYKIPEEYPMDAAALAEPFSIAANILKKAGAEAGESMVIIGAGTIGLAVLQAAKGMGLKVLISDVAERKLEYAQEFGADFVVNSMTEDLSEAVKRAFPDGADITLDAVGIHSLTSQSVEFAASEGRIIVIGFDGNSLHLPEVVITKKELSLIGSRMNCGRFPDVIRWMEDGAVKMGRMITAKYNVEDIQQAFEDTLQNGERNIKTLISFV